MTWDIWLNGLSVCACVFVCVYIFFFVLLKYETSSFVICLFDRFNA